jgi:hypothetical protein
MAFLETLRPFLIQWNVLKGIDSSHIIVVDNLIWKLTTPSNFTSFTRKVWAMAVGCDLSSQRNAWLKSAQTSLEMIYTMCSLLVDHYLIHTYRTTKVLPNKGTSDFIHFQEILQTINTITETMQSSLAPLAIMSKGPYSQDKLFISEIKISLTDRIHHFLQRIKQSLEDDSLNPQPASRPCSSASSTIQPIQPNPTLPPPPVSKTIPTKETKETKGLIHTSMIPTIASGSSAPPPGSKDNNAMSLWGPTAGTAVKKEDVLGSNKDHPKVTRFATPLALPTQEKEFHNNLLLFEKEQSLKLHAIHFNRERHDLIVSDQRSKVSGIALATCDAGLKPGEERFSLSLPPWA